MGNPKYANGFQLTVHDDALGIPLHWKKPRRIFVNSMSDLFHERMPEGFIQKVFAVMREANWHQYQVLTKRSKRLTEMNPRLEWPSNVWMGVSVENSRNAYRINHLRNTNAHIKFLSLEPLLGPLLKLDLSGIDWVIVGGESGPGARPMRKEWVLDIRDQCAAANVAFFFKQWGGINKKLNGRVLDGSTWDAMPQPSMQKRPGIQDCSPPDLLHAMPAMAVAP
jgi:protein gp37